MHTVRHRVAVPLHRVTQAEQQIARGFAPSRCHHRVLAAVRHEDERSAANACTLVFMAHGSQDPVVAPARGEASRDLLLSLGYPVQWHSYPMPHSVHPREVADISLFLADVLG